MEASTSLGTRFCASRAGAGAEIVGDIFRHMEVGAVWSSVLRVGGKGRCGRERRRRC